MAVLIYPPSCARMRTEWEEYGKEEKDEEDEENKMNEEAKERVFLKPPLSFWPGR